LFLKHQIILPKFKLTKIKNVGSYVDDTKFGA